MRLSRRSEYGLRALVDLVKTPPGTLFLDLRLGADYSLADSAPVYFLVALGYRLRLGR